MDVVQKQVRYDCVYALNDFRPLRNLPPEPEADVLMRSEKSLALLGFTFVPLYQS